MKRRVSLLLHLFLLAVAASAQSPSDPIEGKWLGTIGSGRDGAEVGLEIGRSASGGLEAKLSSPLLNIYGTPVTLKREGESYVIQEMALALTLSAGELRGTTAGLKLPVLLKKTDTLPAESPIPDLPKGPDPLWRTQLGGEVFAPVALRDGVAYVGTTNGVFNAVDATSGEILWTFSAGRPVFGEALPTGDAVYFACDNGYLYRLERRSGKEIWKYDLGDARVPRVLGHQSVYDWDERSSRPLLVDGVLFTGSGDGALHAVDAAKGTRVWRFETKDKIRTDPIFDGERIVFGSNDGNVYSVDRRTGRQVWVRETKGPVTSTPALIGGRIVIGNRGSVLYALDPRTGEVAWRTPYWGSWVESTAVPFGDFLYIGSSDLRRVTCHDPKDGRVVWRTDVYGWPWGRPVVTDRRVYIATGGVKPYSIRHEPGLAALDTATGKIVWRWVPPPSQSLQSGFPAGPAYDGRTLVIGSLDGTLYGFPAV